MTPALPSPTKRALLGVAVGGLVVAPVTGIVLTLIVGSIWPAAGPVTLVLILVGAPVTGGVMGHRSATAAHRAAAARATQQQRDRDTHARKLHERDTETARRRISENAAYGERHFAALGPAAAAACDHMEQATKHLEQRAFSPFWSSVESAYAALGQYLESLEAVRRSAEGHPRLIDAYHALGHHEAVEEFPVTLDAANATGTAEAIATPLQAMVYEAQRDPVFAQIWEQRRTTAAVVSGFRNLDHAVSSLAAAVGQSTARLVASVEDGNQSLIAGQQRIAQSVQDTVWFLNDQRNRALGMGSRGTPPPPR